MKGLPAEWYFLLRIRFHLEYCTQRPVHAVVGPGWSMVARAYRFTTAVYTVSGALVYLCWCTTHQSNKQRIAVPRLLFPFVPASHTSLSVGPLVAERLLYVQFVGFCMLLAIGLRICRSIVGVHSVSQHHVRRRHHRIACIPMSDQKFRLAIC